jgi:hypothetical protein
MHNLNKNTIFLKHHWARLQPCSRKCKGTQLQKNRSGRTKRKETITEEETDLEKDTNIVEVITSTQKPTWASWARIAARAAQPEAMDFCFRPTCMEASLLQASGVVCRSSRVGSPAVSCKADLGP